MSRYDYKNGLYPNGDGITKISDPFWLNTCKKCGHKFWSFACTVDCAECGHPELSRELGGIPYEQIIAERGEPEKPKNQNQNKSEFIRVRQSLSEFIRVNQSFRKHGRKVEL